MATTQAGPPAGVEERPRVVLLIGGRSSEHSISCVSGGSVLAALDRARWDVRVVGIDAGGVWHLVSDDPERWRIADGVLPSVDASDPRAWLVPDDGGPRLMAQEGSGAVDLGPVDVVWPLLHGPWGEDGTVQGLLETYGAAYVGSGVLSSAASMDKAAMKQALAAHGLPIGPYELVSDAEWRGSPQRVADRLAFALELPVFVKPARAGSSMGISRVDDWSDLPAAIEAAREHDLKVVVEQGIDGREIECGVLGGDDQVPATAAVCAEVIVDDRHAFYDFEAKYLDDAAELVVPAHLPERLSGAIRAMAVRAFAALDCEGLARVDFFVRYDERVFVNEINTMPGFTQTSLYPRMWRAAGVDYPELVDRLLTLALTRSRGLR